METFRLHKLRNIASPQNISPCLLPRVKKRTKANSFLLASSNRRRRQRRKKTNLIWGSPSSPSSPTLPTQVPREGNAQKRRAINDKKWGLFSRRHAICHCHLRMDYIKLNVFKKYKEMKHLNIQLVHYSAEIFLHKKEQTEFSPALVGVESVRTGWTFFELRRRLRMVTGWRTTFSGQIFLHYKTLSNLGFRETGKLRAETGFETEGEHKRSTAECAKKLWGNTDRTKPVKH